jgi:hypothetical protein
MFQRAELIHNPEQGQQLFSRMVNSSSFAGHMILVAKAQLHYSSDQGGHRYGTEEWTELCANKPSLTKTGNRSEMVTSHSLATLVFLLPMSQMTTN